MARDEKLDWIYKGANSLVDREEYLLGRKVDKPLEQLNEEEKEKKYVLPTPKNHVEHECIPPSIRDFNKIVQAEQVDLSAKLQEDPLVAIKKREEEARRQFLQNPVQLKKLQDALKKKENEKKKRKKSKKKHTDDLDERIREKLKILKTNSFGTKSSKKELKKDKGDALNTILMHKFNALKDKLSEADLNDILNGKESDTSEEDIHKKTKYVSSDSDNEEQRKSSLKKSTYSSEKYNKRKSRSKSKDVDDKKRKLLNRQHKNEDSLGNNDQIKRNTSQSSTRKYRHGTKTHFISKDERYDAIGKRERKADVEYKKRSRSRSRSTKTNRSSRSRSNNKQNLRKDDNSNRKRKDRSNSKEGIKYDDQKLNKRKETRDNKKSHNDNDSDSELDKKIMAQLKILRGETETKQKDVYPVKPHSSKHIENSSSNGSSDSEGNKKTKVMFPEKPKHIGRQCKIPSSDEKQYTRHVKTDILPAKSKCLGNSSKSTSSSSSEREVGKYRYSDSEDEKPKIKSFGLVTSEGKQIALNKTEKQKKSYAQPSRKYHESAKLEKKYVKRMTEEEKNKLRTEMMKDAKVRDKEREDNVKRYREKDKHEEEVITKKYDADLVHTELLKSAKHTSVEQRIKSNLNKIQRSSRHMDQNFSKR